MQLKGRLRGLFHTLIWLTLLGSTLSSRGEDFAELPQPLTLEYALSLVDVEHPVMQQAGAMQQAAQARQRASEAADDISASLQARARWVLPPASSSDEVVDDHLGSLLIRKSLYDFGRSSALQQAARDEAQAMAVRFQSQRDQRRLDIMRAFFDVLLADQENYRDNEALAVAFIALDRLRTRQELGQASDIEVLELESQYQQARSQLQASEARQRLGRAVLAGLLNRPAQLPSELATPSLDYAGRVLPDYDPLLTLAQQHNPTLQALQLELQAAQRRVDSARSEKHPRLDAELEASRYSRELGSSDRWRAGVTLSVPIYNGDRINASVATEQAEVMRLHAKLEQARLELRQTLLQSWFEIQRLTLQREQSRSELDYRELYLDRSRANYEMEVKADLGDAMVRLSEAQLALVKNDFDTALAWQQLAALTGIELMSLADAVSAMPGERE